MSLFVALATPLSIAAFATAGLTLVNTLLSNGFGISPMERINGIFQIIERLQEQKKIWKDKL